MLVRDQGRGIPPGANPPLTTDGIGLHVINTLADQVKFRERVGGGTEVQMKFATPHIGVLEPHPEQRWSPSAGARGLVSGGPL